MCASTLRTWQKLEFKTCYMLLLVIEKVISKAHSQDLNVNSSVANILYTLLNTEIRSHFGKVIDQQILLICSLALPQVKNQSEFLVDQLLSMLASIEVRDDLQALLWGQCFLTTLVILKKDESGLFEDYPEPILSKIYSDEKLSQMRFMLILDQNVLAARADIE